jgi:hypothetical protein
LLHANTVRYPRVGKLFRDFIVGDKMSLCFKSLDSLNSFKEKDEENFFKLFLPFYIFHPLKIFFFHFNDFLFFPSTFQESSRQTEWKYSRIHLFDIICKECWMFPSLSQAASSIETLSQQCWAILSPNHKFSMKNVKMLMEKGRC